MDRLVKRSRDARGDGELGTLARARTFVVLERLGPSGKGKVVPFLAEAELLQGVRGSDPVVELASVDLSGVDLSGLDLSGADLRVANLTGANLSSVDLSDAQMYQVQLQKAPLENADLRGANMDGFAHLQFANLSDADLRSAYMEYVVTFGADLRGADLRGVEKLQLPVQGPTDSPELGETTMPNGSTRDMPDHPIEEPEDPYTKSELLKEVQ